MKTICRTCPHYITNIAKCEYYIKRCTQIKLWNGKVPPPRECPNREKLIELGAMDE